MKHILLCLLLIASGSATFAQVKTDETRTTVNKATGDTTVTSSTTISRSEDITPHNQMIVVNPLKFFLFYNLTYFHRLAPGAALGIGVQMPTFAGLDGFGINAEVRFYPSDRALRGFYIAPNISYSRLTLISDEHVTTPFSVGALFGWQWFPGDDFAIGLGLGIDYYTSTDSGNDVLGHYSGTVPAIRFDIGYAW